MPTKRVAIEKFIRNLPSTLPPRTPSGLPLPLVSHKTKKIKIKGKTVEVDSELAEVIKALNKVGLKTVSCCQGVHITDKYIAHYGKKISLEYHEEAYLIFDAGNITCIKIEKEFEDEQVTIRWLRKIKKKGGLSND